MGLFKRLSDFLLRRIGKSFVPYKGRTQTDLLIYDDIYPHPVSGFRLEEFTVLLSAFGNSKILSDNSAYPIVNTDPAVHQQHISQLLSAAPQLKGKIVLQTGLTNINTRLFYCIFINNIYRCIDWLEKFKIPFAFTLYPGGGFQVYDEESDRKLKRVLRSPFFRKVLVTQLYTRDYLVEGHFCTADKVEYIFGSVVPQISLHKNIEDRKTYLLNKRTFDVCFCAAKYSPTGADKGYDLFIEAAHRLYQRFDCIRFHVVGGFGEKDIDVSAISDRIQFYGYQNFEHLGAIFLGMDVIVSANRPFVLGKGSFDGFPLGTVVEAALNGVVPVLSDALGQNTKFGPEEMVIIENDSKEIEDEISRFINEPQRLYAMSEKARHKFMSVYSENEQMGPRIQLLKAEIHSQT